MSARLRHIVLLVPALVAIAGCRSAMTAIEPAGPQSSTIMRLFWPMTGVLAAVYLLTTLALVPAIRRGRRRAREEGELSLAPHDTRRERRARGVVTVAVGLSVVILLAIVVADFLTTRSLNTIAQTEGIRVRLVGHQWWWEVHYQDSLPSRAVVTANELHVPVGRPVHLSMTSGDVIHAFWVPELNGKKDLIPGYTTDLWLQADRPGVYEGQCGEFCGLQHAKMRLTVIAEPEARYDEWIAAQRRPADSIVAPLAMRGREVFLAAPCAMCHRVGGTSAGSMNGPDLTHVASRRTLAAGALPNTRGALAGWILDPAGVKPGTQMPSTSMKGPDLDALLTFLQSLK
jgi:cytochrome c oxidase subunit 2